jgi:hypothetical protein
MAKSCLNKSQNFAYYGTKIAENENHSKALRQTSLHIFTSLCDLQRIKKYFKIKETFCLFHNEDLA